MYFSLFFSRVPSPFLWDDSVHNEPLPKAADHWFGCYKTGEYESQHQVNVWDDCPSARWHSSSCATCRWSGQWLVQDQYMIFNTTREDIAQVCAKGFEVHVDDKALQRTCQYLMHPQSKSPLMGFIKTNLGDGMAWTCKCWRAGDMNFRQWWMNGPHRTIRTLAIFYSSSHLLSKHPNSLRQQRGISWHSVS